MFIMRSCEDPATLYVTVFGRRFVFRECKYVGWYNLGKKKKA